MGFGLGLGLGFGLGFGLGLGLGLGWLLSARLLNRPVVAVGEERLELLRTCSEEGGVRAHAGALGPGSGLDAVLGAALRAKVRVRLRVRVAGAVGEGRRALGRRKLAARIHLGQGLIGGEGIEQVLRERVARLRRLRLLHPQ